MGVKLMLTIKGGIGQFQMIVPWSYICDLGTNKFDPNGFSSLPGCIKILPLGTNIHVVDGYIHFRIMLFGHQGLFDCVHTTNRGAVAIITAKVSRTNTLDKGH